MKAYKRGCAAKSARIPVNDEGSLVSAEMDHKFTRYSATGLKSDPSKFRESAGARARCATPACRRCWD